MRIGVMLRRESLDLLDKWYLRAGQALHEEGIKPHDPEVAKTLLAEIGVDPSLLDAAIEDPSTHDEIKVEHQRVVESGGYGVPTLFFPSGYSLFGPVILKVPTGQGAIRLWQSICAWQEFPYLFEIQHPKSRIDYEDIVHAFRPYVKARDWVSINRGEIIHIPTDEQLRNIGG